MLQAGLLVLLDGSTHAWLQARGPRLTLLAAVDDATGHVLSAVFREQEDAQGYLWLLRDLVTHHGLPVAVYTDRHSVFEHTPRALTLEEQLRGRPQPTQVGRALQEAGISWIPARSPQAKGRIERLFGAFQDRLITELRLAGITNLEGANACLPDFLTRYTARFAQPAASTESAFRPWPADHDLEQIWCFKYRRTVANDNTLTLGPHHVQLLAGPHRHSYAQARVEVHERLDGTLAVFYQDQRLALQMLQAVSPAPIPARHLLRAQPTGPGSIDALRKQRRKAAVGATRVDVHKPGPEHPWRHKRVGNTNPIPREARTDSLNR